MVARVDKSVLFFNQIVPRSGPIVPHEISVKNPS